MTGLEILRLLSWCSVGGAGVTTVVTIPRLWNANGHSRIIRATLAVSIAWILGALSQLHYALHENVFLWSAVPPRVVAIWTEGVLFWLVRGWKFWRRP